MICLAWGHRSFFPWAQALHIPIFSQGDPLRGAEIALSLPGHRFSPGPTWPSFLGRPKVHSMNNGTCSYLRDEFAFQ